MTDAAFDDVSQIYDRLIDWPKRLGHEEPFYRQLFGELGARSVVDVACGSGRHAAMFHSWGLRVEGADVSPHMIEAARTANGSSDDLNWVVRAFDQPIHPQIPFDVSVCVGNSLALAPDLETVQAAIRQMLTAVGKSGAAVIHVLNLWHLPDGPCVWQKCRQVRWRGADVQIFKGVHRCGSRGYVDMLITRPGKDGPLHSASIPFLGLDETGLDGYAAQNGAKEIELYGGYQGQPYDRNKSVDLVMVMRT
ncbi:MAG: class I SAM-dependent methyltransferase [Pirellulaceae bacterium]